MCSVASGGYLWNHWDSAIGLRFLGKIFFFSLKTCKTFLQASKPFHPRSLVWVGFPAIILIRDDSFEQKLERASYFSLWAFVDFIFHMAFNSCQTFIQYIVKYDYVI